MPLVCASLHVSGASSTNLIYTLLEMTRKKKKEKERDSTVDERAISHRTMFSRMSYILRGVYSLLPVSRVI